MKRASLVLAVVCWSLTTGLDAYTLKPWRWAVTLVPFYVNVSNPDGISAAAVELAARQAADVWATDTIANFAFVYMGRTSLAREGRDGRNVVFFVNATNPIAPGTIATNYYWYNGSGQLTDFDVKLWSGRFKFYGGASGCVASSTVGLRGFYLQDILTHEFGHALGLLHSSVYAATMYSALGQCSQRWRTLADDDIAGAEAAYPPLF